MGKGKNDNTLDRVREGGLKGKGELVVGFMVFSKDRRVLLILSLDDLRKTGTVCVIFSLPPFSKPPRIRMSLGLGETLFVKL